MEISLLSLSYIGWMFFAASLILAIFIGAVLLFHWARYSMNAAVSILASVIYTTVCSALILAMATTLALFSLYIKNPLL